MKTQLSKFMAIIAIMAIAFISCDKSEMENSEKFTLKSVSAIIDPNACGDSSFTLWAGQHHNVGSVLVSNTEEYIYISIVTTGGWMIKATHLHLSDSYEGIPKNRPGVPIPGQFAYSSIHDPFVTEFNYAIPNTWDAGDELYIAIHAEVVKTNNEGTLIQAETAWGGDQEGGSNRWWFYLNYEVVECEEEVIDDPVCETETAWSAGTRYVEQGNWATYTQYNGELLTVNLIAGQDHVIGTVKFKPVAEGVKIIIKMNEFGGFQDVAENVKIQDYESAPSGNPNPGGFSYKGDASGDIFEMTVPVNNFYGVHVDALHCE